MDAVSGMNVGNSTCEASSWREMSYPNSANSAL
jgi:hypothetical protein